jgi:hypothetical protein
MAARDPVTNGLLIKSADGNAREPAFSDRCR